MEYLHGMGQIIPGLERALEGRMIGDQFTITIAPEDAYGERDRDLQQKIPAEIFGGVDKIEVGMQFHAQGEDDQDTQVFLITDVDESEQTITVDANHPLAGMTLKFEVTVDNVREASQEELERGFVTPRWSQGTPRRSCPLTLGHS